MEVAAIETANQKPPSNTLMHALCARRFRSSVLNTPAPSPDYILYARGIEDADDDFKEVDHYPKTELEWLATIAFNYAVDYFLQENDSKCKDWAGKALLLAQVAEGCAYGEVCDATVAAD